MDSFAYSFVEGLCLGLTALPFYKAVMLGWRGEKLILSPRYLRHLERTDF